jgi:hypothetical protein
MMDEIVVRFEDAARDISVGDVEWHDEPLRHVPAGLVDQEHGMGSGRDGRGDLRKMEVHRLGIAGR